MRTFFIDRWMTLLLCAALMPTPAFAKKEPLQEKVEPGQTVLLLGVIDSKPFHRHVSGWVARRLEGDDELIGLIRSRLAGVLTSAGYKAAWETVPEDFIGPFQKGSYLSMGWSRNKVKPQYLPWFREQMQKHGATSVVIFSTTYDHSFGMVSGSGDRPTDAYLVANIGATVLYGDALEAHPYSAYRICQIRIYFSSIGVESPDQIVGRHVVPFNDMIASLAARNVAEHLSNTGLYGISDPPCSSGDD